MKAIYFGLPWSLIDEKRQREGIKEKVLKENHGKRTSFERETLLSKNDE